MVKKPTSWRRHLKNPLLAAALMIPNCSGGQKPIALPDTQEIERRMEEMPPDCQAARKEFQAALEKAISRIIRFENDSVSLGNFINMPKEIQIAFQPPITVDDPNSGSFRVCVSRQRGKAELLEFPEIVEIYRAWERLQNAQTKAKVPSAERIDAEHLNKLALSIYFKKANITDENKLANAAILLDIFLTGPLKIIAEMRPITHDEQDAIDRNFGEAFHKVIADLEKKQLLNKNLKKDLYKHIVANSHTTLFDMSDKAYKSICRFNITTSDGVFYSLQPPSHECREKLKKQFSPDTPARIVLDILIEDISPSSIRGAQGTVSAQGAIIRTIAGEIKMELSICAPGSQIAWPPAAPPLRTP